MIYSHCIPHTPHMVTQKELIRNEGRQVGWGEPQRRQKVCVNVYNTMQVYWVVQAGSLTPLPFTQHHVSPVAVFTSSAYFLQNGISSSSSSNWILMSCQPHRVTSGQSNSGYDYNFLNTYIHISKLFSHIYQSSVKSVYKTNHFANIKHAYTNIRHIFSKSQSLQYYPWW